MSDHTCDPKAGVTRRQFLFMGGAALVTLATPKFLQGVPQAESLRLQLAAYPRKKVAQLSAVTAGKPVEFKYPFNHPNCSNFIYKLGTEAGGGVGPAKDVVAFNNLCTHQGGPLSGKLNTQHQVLGPCPLHLSTFDLTRHGMVVSGQATEGLPQITLEVEGDDIYATGVMGLVYGFHNNTVDPAA
ncbi:MAG: arsenate reductase (azurin) small subunit [Chloroflexi bacterium]|nr:arsenate reductase (azurin) small subunit [Chloroflexota bacterium]